MECLKGNISTLWCEQRKEFLEEYGKSHLKKSNPSPHPIKRQEPTIPEQIAELFARALMSLNRVLAATQTVKSF